MSLEHRAFVYGGTDHFLAVTEPFLRSGLEAGQAVVAVAQEPNLSALHDLFGDDAEIEWVDAATFYLHPVRTLRDYQALVNKFAPRTVCALAEPVWRGWDERQTLEWIRYESLINEVFKDSGARALCPYDSEALSPRILEEARRTHPMMVTDGPALASGAYVDPVTFGANCDRSLRFSRPGDAEYFAVEDDDLHALRSFVAERALLHGLAKRPAQNLVTAVNEVAANALQHGVPPVGMWIWQDGPELLCEVGDNGLWRPAPTPLTGFIPPDSALQRGFGLWTVRLLVDLMELRAGWDGTFVRLHIR
ncbi:MULTISPECIES: anti-sigma factor RsbA family regulatory protein [Actinomadura]|jgi:anti-sigma regulatory factor (Ser/Thr protein kinase)|uniref:Sensor histidine kinase n=1 Tax=Actinomadura montaniterrae TaxID=1803903 RepID=A0A6L3VHH6_9ACTN|nr:anti-sigma factor RsbA family regulatory protein [Actinomadura montaniterrae]KAB2361862.1 sensor histidine kinase [Actinomadura montaniterrae]